MRSVSNNEEIRQALREILQSPEFQKYKTKDLWQHLLDKIRHWFEIKSGGNTDSSVWKWLGTLIEAMGYPAFFILVILLLILIGYLIVKLSKFLNSSNSDISVHMPSRTAIKTLGELRIDADAENRRGNYKGALRLYYQALLLELDQKKSIVYRSYKTNREYLREIDQNKPNKSATFRQFVNLFEGIWYGGFICTQKDLILGISLMASIGEVAGDEK